MITYCLQRYDFFLIPPKMPCRNVLVTSVTATTVTTSGRCENFGTKIDSAAPQKVDTERWKTEGK